MQAVRFLADYINGDTYYKIAYPKHNLVRTRSQWQYYLCTRPQCRNEGVHRLALTGVRHSMTTKEGPCCRPLSRQ